jgi:hypothetical protein
MTEEEWLKCNETNLMFAAMETPSDEKLTLFNLSCCLRIRHLISDDVTLRTLDALERAENCSAVPAELALAANEVGTSSEYFNPSSPLYNPIRNISASKAVGHAVRRFLPMDSFYYSSDAVDNSKMVALYCQIAAEDAADPDRDVDSTSREAFSEDDVGRLWLKQRARAAEKSAQCEFIRTLFTRRA